VQQAIFMAQINTVQISPTLWSSLVMIRHGLITGLWATL
jgi:hypothetical protein